MRKIIKGRRYDTATARHVATDTYTDEKEDEEFQVIENLYVTEGGAFFMIRDTHGPDLQDDYNHTPVFRQTWEAYTRDDAESWFNAGLNVDLHDESVFAEPDEAAADEGQERTISMTVRVPANLRDQLSKAASKESISMNAYMVRCAKRCLAS